MRESSRLSLFLGHFDIFSKKSTKFHNNYKVKGGIKKHLKTLESKENAVLYNERLVYIKCVPCKIGQKENRPAYAYLCKDMTMHNEEQKHTIERAHDESLSGADIFDDLQKKGVFVLITTRKVAKDIGVILAPSL